MDLGSKNKQTNVPAPLLTTTNFSEVLNDRGSYYNHISGVYYYTPIPKCLVTCQSVCYVESLRVGV